MKKVILTAIITILICIGLLVVTAFIPQSAIKSNVSKSADELINMELFDHVTDNALLSRQDNYADGILVDIIYNIDSHNLRKSLASMPYYDPNKGNISKSLKEVTEADYVPFNDLGGLSDGYIDYSRYWHGSQVILRPLLVMMSLKSLRMVLGIVLVAITMLLLVLMFRDGYGCLGICYAGALIIISAWMCAFCVEYITTFLIMGVQLLLLYKYRKNLDAVRLYMILCAGGIVTAFVDFLTTETITFTMPMLFFYIIRRTEGQRETVDKENWWILLKSGIVWGISYAGMILLKWLLAMAAMGSGVFLDTLSKASERIAGDATYGNIPGAATVSNLEQITGAVWRNLACLFRTGESVNKGRTVLYTLIALFVLFAIWYLFHKKLDRGSGQLTLILLVLALIPYIRFLVLNNHAYIHFFFTYRAQIVTITALLYLAFKNVPFAGELRTRSGKRMNK